MIHVLPIIGERWGCILRYIVCLICTFQTGFAQDSGTKPDSARQQVIIIVGAPGTDEYKTTFASWADRWKTAAERADEVCSVVGEVARPASDLEELTSTIVASIAVETTEPVWIVFIGHGTFDGRTASLNLNGPDISADTLAGLLRTSKRPIAFIACASCSAPFINALSGPDRIVISATKDGNQIQYSRFGDAMSQAISELEADINRDGQTSLLEAWLFASRRTAEFYATEGRLATEHALLDDNGDSKGTRAEVYDGDRLKTDVENIDQLDGSQAARWHLIRSDEERHFTPEQRQTRDDLEQLLAKLRQRQNTLTEDEYLVELESILVPLARLYESINLPALQDESGPETK